MNEDDFAKALLSHERKEWQDPQKILSQLEIKKGMTVADLACGPGFFAIPLAKAVGEKGIVYAVDSSKVMLEYLSENIRRSKIKETIIKLIHSDITATKIPSNSIDLTFLALILHDASDSRLLFSEIKRISKKESHLVIIEWRKKDTGIGPPVEIRLSEKEARSKIAENGFKVIRKIEAGRFHYGFVCKQNLI
jgi:ubiquinone/menaquinone biosynthesis C-methylase UbiE